MRTLIIYLVCLAIGILVGAVISHFRHKFQNKDKLQDYIVKMYSSNGKNLKKQVKQQKKQLKTTAKQMRRTKL